MVLARQTEKWLKGRKMPRKVCEMERPERLRHTASWMVLKPRGDARIRILTVSKAVAMVRITNYIRPIFEILTYSK